MTTQNPHGSQSDNETADLVRSVALSSARLWEEVLERLVRVERSQVELTQTLSRLQAALPSATGTTGTVGAPGLPGPSARSLGLPAPPPPPPPPMGANLHAIEVDGVEVANYEEAEGRRGPAPLELVTAAPDAGLPTAEPPGADMNGLAEPVQTFPEPVSGIDAAAFAAMSIPEGGGADVLAPPPPPPGFSSGGDLPPPPPPGFEQGAEASTEARTEQGAETEVGGSFLDEGPTELPEPQRSRRFGFRRKAKKGPAPTDQTAEVQADAILAAAGTGAQPEMAAPASVAGALGNEDAEPRGDASAQVPADVTSQAPGWSPAGSHVDTAEPSPPVVPVAPPPPEPWGLQSEPAAEGAEGAAPPEGPSAWAPPPPEPVWAAAPPPPPEPAWAPPSQDQVWAAAPPPPPEPAWTPPPPEPAWAAAPPPPPVVPVVPVGPSAPAAPVAPAGFSLEDLQGEGAIGAPPPPPPPPPAVAPPPPVGPTTQQVPVAPAGFSLEDLQGEGAIGAPPPPPPPPPPPGFSAPADSLESLDLDPAPDVRVLSSTTGWENIAPAPTAVPGSEVQAPPSTSEQIDPSGSDWTAGRQSAPPPPAGFSAADFSGHDAIGGSAEPPPAPSPATLMGGQVPEPPITPDFFARAGRKRH